MWAGGGSPDLSEAVADAERIGLPAALAEQLANAEPPLFEVWPENMPVIDIWLAISSQWRTAPLADGRVHWLGLDYAAVRAGLELAGLLVSPGQWAGVQLIERTAAATLNGVRG